MSNLTINPQWHDAINQVETDEFITGGADGNANLATRQLAENLFWLKDFVMKLPTGTGGTGGTGNTGGTGSTGGTGGTGSTGGTTTPPTFSMGIDLSSSRFTAPDTVNFIAYISPHGDIDRSRPMEVTMSLTYMKDEFTLITIETAKTSWNYNSALSGTIEAVGNKLERAFVLPADRTYQGVTLNLSVSAYTTAGTLEGFGSSTQLSV